MNKYIHALLNTPPTEIPSKSFWVIKKNILFLYEKIQNRFRPSYCTYPFIKNSQLQTFFTTPSKELFHVQSDQIKFLSNNYLAHRFDLLGSGWVIVKHGVECRGLEGNNFSSNQKPKFDKYGNWLRGKINKSNLHHSQNVWRMINPDYSPIDWHLDFLSGYRWSEDTWYMDINYGHKLGVDIKVPWELARMQHLPQFAYAYLLAKQDSPGFENPEKYFNEFKNQILDFIATNPPRYGVNWRCAMDVAIRAVNWLVAYDLLKSSGASFDEKFEKVFITSIYDHGVHIVNNLEWSPDHTSNHYLANIAGLVFISTYLPESEEINSWLAFSVRELISETKIQFNEEGTNYEGSTNYHRLSSEMVAYSAALILGLPENKYRILKDFNSSSIKFPFRPNPSKIQFYKNISGDRDNPFPTWFIERLERMALFTEIITKPNGMIPQIGDNDSGRFLKLDPKYRTLPVFEVEHKYKNLKNYQFPSKNTEYMMEDHLDHYHVSSSISRLFQNITNSQDSITLENNLISILAENRKFSSTVKLEDVSHPTNINIGSESLLEEWIHKLNSIPIKQKKEHTLPIIDLNIDNKLKLYSFKNFGLFIFKTTTLYLAIRCGIKNDKAPSGHFHNDQLAIELNIGGEDITRDPGTYVYTPLPHRRNEYRSAKAHWTPRIDGKEPNHLSNLLFRLDDRSKGKCLYFGEKGFLGMHSGYGNPIYRMILIKEDSIIIDDFTEADEEIISDSPFDKSNNLPYSPGYGMIQNT